MMGNILSTGILFMVEVIAQRFMDIVKFMTRIIDAGSKILEGDWKGCNKIIRRRFS